MDTEIWISYNFHIAKYFFNIFQSLQKLKLSLFALLIWAVGQVWPVGHIWMTLFFRNLLTYLCYCTPTPNIWAHTMCQVLPEAHCIDYLILISVPRGRVRSPLFITILQVRTLRLRDLVPWYHKASKVWC